MAKARGKYGSYHEISWVYGTVCICYVLYVIFWRRICETRLASSAACKIRRFLRAKNPKSKSNSMSFWTTSDRAQPQAYSVRVISQRPKRFNLRLPLESKAVQPGWGPLEATFLRGKENRINTTRCACLPRWQVSFGDLFQVPVIEVLTMIQNIYL